MLELSIIIVNWNTGRFLDQCVQSILKTTENLLYEIIVVDNASVDGSAESIRRNFGNCEKVRLITNTDNTGFAQGNNQGYAISTGKFIIILNPDTIIQPYTFKRMVEYAECHPEVGIVGCRFVNPDGTLQRHYRRFPKVSDIFFTYTVLGYHLDRFVFRLHHNLRYHVHDLDFSTITHVDQPGATCILIPRTVIEAIGELFDEQFPIFFNDVDLCRRVLDQGFEIRILPDAQVVHYHVAGVKQLSTQRLFDLEYQAAFRYFRKHHSLPEAALVCLIGVIGRLTNPLLLNAIRHIKKVRG